MKEQIVIEINKVLKKLYESYGDINKINIEVNKTTDSSHGELYTNIAMKLAKILKKNPMLIAKEIVDDLETINDVEKTDVASPGYINFFITKSNKFQELYRIIKNDLNFDKVNNKKNIHVEYVSANQQGHCTLVMEEE